MTDANSSATTATPERRTVDRRFDRPKVPHVAFLRELTMPDGRKVTVDKRHVAFICEATKGENGAKAIIGARSMRSGVPVVDGYHDLVDWWRREITPANGRSA